MLTDLREKHQQQIERLAAGLVPNRQPLRVKKKTISNLFRYDGRNKADRKEIDLSKFDKPLYLDKQNKTLEVQGLATFEKIVDFTLPQGLLPFITPELKHITIGGATVGIGIEANTHKYGFVHNSLIEADVLLTDGRIVTCSATNEYADLFNGLANSYGTLGYILRVKMKLRPAKPYMKLVTKKFKEIEPYLAALKTAEKNAAFETVEGLVYGPEEFYLTTGKQISKPEHLKTIYKDAIFYQDISKPGTFSLPTKEYLFRYDPEWFWNMPETKSFQAMRKILPKRLRNSSFYTRYTKLNLTLPFVKDDAKDEQLEHLIQDWEVPWKYAKSLLNFIFETVDLNKKPLAIVLVKIPKAATNYPLTPHKLYLNVGSYSFIKRKPGQERFDATKAIDAFCFSHEGLKMLYSSTFVSKAKFDQVYNGKDYAKLKEKYDPQGLVPTLFEKAVGAR
jgi:hypothetical protein